MLNIALAGLGTVGAGVVRLLQQNGGVIAARAGQPVAVKAVSARDKNKKRDCNLSGIEWVDDIGKLAQMPGIDAVVEQIGGAEGPVRELAEAALRNRKHYITANKALLAAHGVELAKLAEQNGVQLLFEAAVAGGIPVIKALREGLAGNRISVVYGIINGTCNYILTRMRTAQLDFQEALSEAQKKGYTDPGDPAFDIDGHDAACKLSLLSALAFGVEPDLKSIAVEGIRRVTSVDLQFAEELDCRIKLLGVARMSDVGLEQHVGLSLVRQTSPLAHVEGAQNAVLMRGDFVGDIMLQGQGAGAEPTASAVVADIVDLARGCKPPAFGVPAAQLKKPALNAARESCYYMRMQVMDKPGVVADISAILRDEAISIESLLQRGKSATQSVPVVMTTHAANAAAMHRAAGKIAKVPTVVEKPCLMCIED